MEEYKHRRDDYKPRAQYVVFPSFLSWLAPIVGPIQISDTRHWMPGITCYVLSYTK
jgi:hypothetical protein